MKTEEKFEEKFIDLHTHSCASDGADTPENLIVKAKKIGLSAIALTDHDNFNGIERAQKKADELGIEFITGIELSTDHKVGEIHILGYWLDKNPLENEGLKKASIELKAKRDERNENIFKNLAKLNMPLTIDDVVLEMQGLDEENSTNPKHTINLEEDLMCRPHFARAMVRKGYVPNLQVAFKKYLAQGGLAYAPRGKLSQQRAIEVLRESGAIVSFAHPYLAHFNSEDERKAGIKKLKDYGLQGLESIYSTNSIHETALSISYAKEFNLAITGGSDYHGKEVKPHIKLGKGTGSLQVPYSVLEDLRELAKNN